MDKHLLSLHEAAARLSVSPTTLNRWHHMNWAAATDYEEVSVPRAGRISVRRWSATAVDQLSSRAVELLAREKELRAFRRQCRKFGKEIAHSFFYGKVQPEPPFAVCEVADASIDGSGIPISVKDTIASFLKETHIWVIDLLRNDFKIDLSNCELEVSWYQISAREFWSPFSLGSSRGGSRTGRYFVKIMAGERFVHVKEFKSLISRNFYRDEYEFLAKDTEIGSCDRLTAFGLVARTYLHEISHAAELWLRKNNRELEKSLIDLEKVVRSAAPHELGEQDRDGHGLAWSAIYRTLVRAIADSVSER